MAYIPNPNQSVSGTVGASVIGLPPVNLNVGGSPVTTTNPVPVQPPASGSLPVINVGSIITVSQGSVAAVIIGGSIAASFTPPANQSVSGAVSVSNFPTTQNISGSVFATGSITALQGTNPWTVTSSIAGGIFPISGSVGAVITNFPTTQNVSGSVAAVITNNPTVLQLAGSVLAVSGSFTPAANQSVSGTVGASVIGHAPVVIVGGSIAASFTPPANQSVSGAVSVSNFPTTQNVSGSVISYQLAGSVLATSATVNPAANQSVSGTVQVDVRGSVATVIIGGSIAASFTPPANQSVSGTVTTNQGTTPWIITGSVQGTFSSGNSSVQVLNFPANQSVSGTVGTTQSGTWISSIVNTVPSSVIVGASIFGQLPAGTATLGSVAAIVSNFPTTQNVSGSVAAVQVGTNRVSVISSTPSSMLVGASIFGTAPVTQATTPWVISSVYGNVSGSVVAFQGTNPWIITSSVTGGLFPISGSVAATITNFPTTQNVSGSVAAFQGTTEWTVKSSIAGGIFPISGSVAATVTNTSLNINGSVAAWLQSTNASVITVGTAVPNQSVSGAVSVSNFPTTQNVSGSVAAWLQSTNASVITVGSPVANQSVSGAVSVSNFPTTQNVSGSVAAWLQSTNASVITVGTAAPNQSVSGTVTVEQGTTPWITVPTSGSILAVPTGNQSVSGTVGTTQSGTWISSIVNTVPSSVLVGASIFGTAPVTQSGTWNPSISAIVPGTGATNLGKAQDTAAGTTDTGVAPMLIQTSTLATLSQADGDYVNARADKYGNTWMSMGTQLDQNNDNVTVWGKRNDTLASVAAATGSVATIATDSAGRILIKPFTADDTSAFTFSTSVVSTSVTLIKASVIGKRNYITDFWANNTGATTTLLTFQGGDTSVVGYTIVPTGGGTNSPGLAIPLKTTQSQDLAFKVTSASSVVYLTVNGYQAP